MRILGIDPGLQRTGYGVLDVRAGGAPVVVEAGVIRSSADKDLAGRVAEIYAGVADLLDDLKPGCLAVEELYSVYKHPRTAILMGHARGVVFLAAAQRDLPVKSYAATHVKRDISGNGHAGKVQMQHAIKRLLNLERIPHPNDVADALAVALCHCHAWLRRQPKSIRAVKGLLK